MANFFVLFLVVICTCVIVNAQDSIFGQKQGQIGQTFEEVIVSSDLNVRRKSKENRQGKKILTNIPSATTSQTGNPTVSRLISDDGTRVVSESRNRRDALLTNRFYLLPAEKYLLNSSN